MSTTPTSTPMALTPTARKRRRLNYACNACRQRKIRCDEQQPSCHNCLVNGNPCVTTDKRRPGVSIQRHQAGRQSLSTTASQPNLSPSSTSGTRDLTDYQADVAVTTPAPATEEVHLTPDSHAEVRTDGSLVFSGRLPILIHSSGRTGVEILSDWLGLAFHRLNFRHRLDPSSVLSSVPSAPSVLDTVVTDFPPLPSRETARKLVDRFFTDVNSIFNLLDASEVLTDLDAVYAHGPDCVVRDRGLAPVLRLYLVFSTSSFSLLEIESLDFSRKCIGFCQTMLGHVIGWNDMEGIQIVFLLSLSLRSQDKVSLSWATIGLCVLMAVSLGLNRQKIPSEKGFSEVERAKEARKRRTWWCVYAFEKLHAFELGKGSSIVDADCSQPDPGCGDGEVPGSFSEPSTLVGLAKVLGLISRRCIQVRNREEKAITESAIAEKVRTTGESCLSLVKWAERLEEKYRPTSTMFTGSQASAFAVFLATSFNNALIMLTRNSMLISDTVHNATFEVLAKEQPWARFVGPRSAVATNAARHTVRFLTECAEFNSSIALPSIIVPLQAAYILIVQVVTHQASRTTASDLILIDQACDLAREHYALLSKDNKLEHLLGNLRNFLSDNMRAARDNNATIPLYPPQATADTSSGMFPPTLGEASRTTLSPTDGFIAAGQTIELNNSGSIVTGGLNPAPLTETSWTPGTWDELGWDWMEISQLISRPPSRPG